MTDTCFVFHRGNNFITLSIIISVIMSPSLYSQRYIWWGTPYSPDATPFFPPSKKAGEYNWQPCFLFPLFICSLASISGHKGGSTWTTHTHTHLFPLLPNVIDRLALDTYDDHPHLSNPQLYRATTNLPQHVH